jgi:hypothetical protein
MIKSKSSSKLSNNREYEYSESKVPSDQYKHTPKQPVIKDGSPKFLQINLKMFNNYLTGNHCGSVNIDNN